ncbi:MAG: heavy metal-binding domain-containing protein [Pseudonocardia sp.]|uniref:heavy metal-binding domain-containing protein n=1 Tax=unclassified Pseudonocardia TaxID=2619320 RepID=UPI00086EF98A|nr:MULTISPECIES: heavy metal-binding domain-containing protein [unclassified Pseudonocardia]MBN9109295.1 heavy metal-binding domain-containing protein [Pseudonocardia sp.]ODU23162.1 MAG: hypothetical protein ABS80_15800 [Pseudonocardia sp. SCN 72-51]ODV08013.1 MAG: hypothetical protein ABT15_04780 [Pseudonocardia sp. SCN 73-27]
MAEWDGRGLPPVAAERIRRAAAGGAWTSLLSAPAAAGLEAAGFDAVGEVMGSMVARIGWAGYRGCGGYGWGAAPRTITSSDGDRFSGFAPYVQALYAGYGTAIGRLVTEASAIGADGVVGIRLGQTTEFGGAREFTALGTAVRARSATRPGRIFTTVLDAQDVAKLLQAGWVPTQIVYGISVAIRHDDWATRAQASWNAGNIEVDGYTELVGVTRADARRLLHDAVRRSGADGAVVDDMTLAVWSVEPGENHRDHVAEATVFGTALARFHTGRVAPTRSLTYLPLR